MYEEEEYPGWDEDDEDEAEVLVRGTSLFHEKTHSLSEELQRLWGRLCPRLAWLKPFTVSC